MIGVEEEFPSSRGRTQLATKSSEIIDDRSTLLLPLSKKDKQKERKKKRDEKNENLPDELSHPFAFNGIFPWNISLSRRKKREMFNSRNFQRIYIYGIMRSLSRGLELRWRYVSSRDRLDD